MAIAITNKIDVQHVIYAKLMRKIVHEWVIHSLMDLSEIDIAFKLALAIPETYIQIKSEAIQEIMSQVETSYPKIAQQVDMVLRGENPISED